MGIANITVSVTDLEVVKTLVEATRALVMARMAGADVYEARHEVDAVERALAVIDGVSDKVCSECREQWAPNHRHLDDVEWVDA